MTVKRSLQYDNERQTSRKRTICYLLGLSSFLSSCCKFLANLLAILRAGWLAFTSISTVVLGSGNRVGSLQQLFFFLLFLVAHSMVLVHCKMLSCANLLMTLESAISLSPISVSLLETHHINCSAIYSFYIPQELREDESKRHLHSTQLALCKQ